jgi:hypothetical protein
VPAAAHTARRRLPYAVAGAVLVVETATHLVNFGLYDEGARLLDSSSVWSYSHLLAVLAFAVGAIVCAWGGANLGGRRRAWWLAAALFAFLFLDEITRLHDHIGLWPLIYAPILLALTLCVTVVARGTIVEEFVYAGLALLFVSLGIHVLGPPVVRGLGWSPTSWAYQVKIALKEGTELAGWVLVVPALARLSLPRN